MNFGNLPSANIPPACVDALRQCAERFPTDQVYAFIVAALIIGFLCAFLPQKIREWFDRRGQDGQ